MDTEILIKELDAELREILQYWMLHMPDLAQKGFYGRIDENNIPDTTAPKGSVLNARILWTFSAARNYDPRPEYVAIADRAYDYIRNYFFDQQYRGIYWSVDRKGNPLDTKNQVYALAFVIYGCSEYFKCNQSEPVRKFAIDLYTMIERYSYDEERGGYFEAFTQDWKPLQDLRLSAKDANEKKTMNTHLHILEAYTNLYRIWPDEKLKTQIKKLCIDFEKRIFNPETKHLGLFFDENWQLRSETISYGHDIEASWLLCEAAQVIDDQLLWRKMVGIAQSLVESVSFGGFDIDGGLWYEFEPGKKHLVKEKHWWPQAEALVGFVNAWQYSGRDKYLEQAFRTWDFIKKYMKDREQGEWYWGRDGQGKIMPGQDKAGFWKCPYHNGRACMEVIQRLRAADASPSLQGAIN